MSERQGEEPARRVDARQLESALLALRRRIVDVPLLLEAPGVAQARAERRKLLTQIDDYLLPRVRQSAAPLLVALVGSTGAGKSTLVNSIVGQRVSQTGIRRPTTNSPVLACHPDEIDWFAENVFLPTLPRVRQQGLAMPGRDGLLVLAASEGMPKGVALLDTPDIDSVVQAHHEFAHQFLDASDLWLFVTTGSRYADAPVWELLRYAKERDAALGIVLSRVQPRSRAELTRHFTAMLEANGMGGVDRFLIPETVITEGMLPPAVYGPIREWLADAAVREDRRVAVLTQTMSGVLDTFRTRVPQLASHLATQLTLRAQLRQVIEDSYGIAATQVDEATRNGSLLRGETLARWQDFAGTGDLLRTLQSRRRGGASRPRKRRISARAQALKAAVASGLESLIVSIGDRAAEEAVARWRDHPAGAALLEQPPPVARPRPRRPRPAGDSRSPFEDADSPFADASASPSAASPATPASFASSATPAPFASPATSASPASPATLASPATPTSLASPATSATFSSPASADSADGSFAVTGSSDGFSEFGDYPASTSPFADSPAQLEWEAAGWGSYGTAEADGSAASSASSGAVRGESAAAALGRASPELARRAAQAISSWQEHVMHLVQAENVTKRSIARAVTFDEESLALVVIIGLLGFGAGDAAAAEGTGAAAQDLLNSLFGPGPLREIGAKARADLSERVRLLFDEEMLRFAELIDADGEPDEAAAVQLYQATYSLEVVR
jgi:energy-coupling factor transporter ATP-binding protein EcfA2